MLGLQNCSSSIKLFNSDFPGGGKKFGNRITIFLGEEGFFCLLGKVKDVLHEINQERTAREERCLDRITVIVVLIMQ